MAKGKKRLKVKRYPREEFEKLTPVMPHLPEPVKVLVESIQADKVEEIVFKEPLEPTTWEKLKNWFSGD